VGRINHSTVKAVILAEHLAAIVVLTLVIGWLTLLHQEYQRTVLPLQRYAIAQQMALTALKHKHNGQYAIVFGNRHGEVVVGTDEIQVAFEGHNFTFRP